MTRPAFDIVRRFDRYGGKIRPVADLVPREIYSEPDEEPSKYRFFDATLGPIDDDHAIATTGPWLPRVNCTYIEAAVSLNPGYLADMGWRIYATPDSPANFAALNVADVMHPRERDASGLPYWDRNFGILAFDTLSLADRVRGGPTYLTVAFRNFGVGPATMTARLHFKQDLPLK